MVGIGSTNSEPKSVQAGFSAIWPISVSASDNTVRFIFDYKFGPDDDAPEWEVVLQNDYKEIWSAYRKEMADKVERDSAEVAASVQA